MLTHLAIQDYAIVDHLEVDLNAGMTCITGETGAGKSIMLDALGLCVGDRAETRSDAPEPVEADELNAWKRGFTPQAEIWNGRLAMIGLSAGIAVVLLVRVFSGG